MRNNVDAKVVAGFGDEWSRFDHSTISQAELTALFETYFEIFPWELIGSGAVGFDMGCGSGRWAKLVAPRVGELHLIDPSEALEVARRNLSGFDNCVFHRADVDSVPLEDDSCDFGYSLGVLHHVPDTAAGISACVAKLKSGAPFLLYLYYAFDNQPRWYRWIWKSTDWFRGWVSGLPHSIRYGVTQIVAAVVYFPLARIAWLLEKAGVNIKSFPLSQYRNHSFYVMRTDALDRFGTALEQRFTKSEVEAMMLDAGLEDIKFSDKLFWTAVGKKK